MDFWPAGVRYLSKSCRRRDSCLAAEMTHCGSRRSRFCALQDSYSITWSARTSSPVGNSIRSAFAVLRLKVSSIFTACSTVSAGFTARANERDCPHRERATGGRRLQPGSHRSRFERSQRRRVEGGNVQSFAGAAGGVMPRPRASVSALPRLNVRAFTHGSRRKPCRLCMTLFDYPYCRDG